MTVKAIHFPRWTTASIADAADSVPMELENLGSHYSACNTGADSRWFAVRCAAEAVHDFFAPRFVTTLCAAAAAIALIVLVV